MKPKYGVIWIKKIIKIMLGYTKSFSYIYRVMRWEWFSPLNQKPLKKQVMTQVEKVIKTGVHKCINGTTFPYQVTNFDMEREEFTTDFEVNMMMRNGKINPQEIFRLLAYLYPTKN